MWESFPYNSAKGHDVIIFGLDFAYFGISIWPRGWLELDKYNDCLVLFVLLLNYADNYPGKNLAAFIDQEVSSHM